MIVNANAEAFPLTPHGKRWIQDIVGSFLYYKWVIYGTILSALSSIGAAIGKGDIKPIKRNIIQFLNYAATHPNTKIIYKASDMYL